MPQRTLDAGGVTFAIILGLLAGPVIFYALAGDYWHSTGLTVNHLYAGIVGAGLGLGALFNAARYRNAGSAGAISGLAGGVGELAVAVVPWIGLTYARPTCDPNTVCPLLGANDLTQLALTVGIFAIIVFSLAGYSLAALINAIRGQVHHA
jgi:hypothetical protein